MVVASDGGGGYDGGAWGYNVKDVVVHVIVVAAAAAAAVGVIFFRGTHKVRDNLRSIFNYLF